ncbi:MAG TPA: hypothetical protein VIY66_15400 [Candidatus Acidoferrales bacterium]
MAKPIAVMLKPPAAPTARARTEELERKLGQAPMQHAAALLDMYELIEMLHQRGTLDLLRGLVGAGTDIVGRISAGLNSPEAIRGMRNLALLAKIAGEIDPKLLENVTNEITESSRHKKGQKPPTLWSIFKKLRGKNSRRALAATVDMLDSIGKGLASQQ